MHACVTRDPPDGIAAYTSTTWRAEPLTAKNTACNQQSGFAQQLVSRLSLGEVAEAWGMMPFASTPCSPQPLLHHDFQNDVRSHVLGLLTACWHLLCTCLLQVSSAGRHWR